MKDGLFKRSATIIKKIQKRGIGSCLWLKKKKSKKAVCNERGVRYFESLPLFISNTVTCVLSGEYCDNNFAVYLSVLRVSCDCTCVLSHFFFSSSVFQRSKPFFESLLFFELRCCVKHKCGEYSFLCKRHTTKPGTHQKQQRSTIHRPKTTDYF